MTSIFNQFFNKGKDDREPAEIEYINDKKIENDQITITAQIYGRVQGVGFRFTTDQLAKELGVDGFVRNEEDGSVYVEASAKDEVMKSFIFELAKSPSPSASVNKVVVKYEDHPTNHQGFTIQH